MAEKKTTTKRKTTTKKTATKTVEPEIVNEALETTDYDVVNPEPKTKTEEEIIAEAVKEEKDAIKAVEEKMDEIKEKETMGNAVEVISEDISKVMDSIEETEAEVEKVTDGTSVSKALETGDVDDVKAEINKVVGECKKIHDKLEKGVKKSSNKRVSMTGWWNGWGM